MRSSHIAAMAIAAIFVSTPVLAQTQTPPTPTQTTPQTNPPTPPTPPTTTPPSTLPPQTPQTTTPRPTIPTSRNSGDKDKDKAALQTFTGCLMTEPDYRRAHNLGKGALGGAGLGDEYVLVDVTVSPASPDTPSSSQKSSSSTRNPSRTAGVAGSCSDQGTAYRLTGSQEKQLKGMVGSEVTVEGRFKHADDVAEAGTSAGDKLPAEVEIVSYHAAKTSAAVTEPPVSRTPPPTTTEPRDQSPTQPRATSTTPERELPHSASSTGLVALVGLLALGLGVTLTLMRRYSA